MSLQEGGTTTKQSVTLSLSKSLSTINRQPSTTMNYIRHLTGFYEKIHEDSRLNPTHISLYLALFQFWNLNHFQNPISISRNEMMKLSKIAAYGTYHKCIKDIKSLFHIKTTEQKLWLRSSEVKALLKISSGTLQNLRINGTLRYSKVGGTIYYNYQDIEKLFKEK